MATAEDPDAAANGPTDRDNCEELFFATISDFPPLFVPRAPGAPSAAIQSDNKRALFPRSKGMSPVNDEVSVAELLEREGWQEDPSAASSRFRVVAVMLAVVLGCGLAAILVHLGSQAQQADSPNPAIFDLPHGPTGGLAGGGVPAGPEETEVTGTTTSITVTNEAAPGGSNGIPWAARHRRTSTVPVTQADGQPSVTQSLAPPGVPGDTGTPGGTPPSQTPPSGSHAPPPAPCLLGLLLC